MDQLVQPSNSPIRSNRARMSTNPSRNYKKSLRDKHQSDSLISLLRSLIRVLKTAQGPELDIQPPNRVITTGVQTTNKGKRDESQKRLGPTHSPSIAQTRKAQKKHRKSAQRAQSAGGGVVWFVGVAVWVEVFLCFSPIA